MFVVVFTDDKKDFRPTTIEKYDEIGLKYFLKPEVSRQIKSRRKTTVNGYPALQSEVLGVSEERNLIYLHTTVETPGAFYEIVAWTRPSLYESNLLMIQEIIQSFRENGQ
jgi:hypothetical protein